MSKKGCIYTCITGTYDDVKEFDFKENEFDYILFTNNKNITSDFWTVVYIENDGLDNIRLARKIKILGHPILENYEFTLWLDGAQYLKKNISEFLKICDLDKYDLIGFKHPDRDCIYDEAKACIIYGRDKKDTILKELSYLKKHNYPAHNGLIESSILLRKNTACVSKTMHTWFDMIKKFSYRDQLSFNYAAYVNNLNFYLFDMRAFDNEFFGRDFHRINMDNRLKKCRVYFGEYSSLDDYDYRNDFLEDYKLENGVRIINVVAPSNGKELNIRLDNVGGIRVDNIYIDNKKNVKIDFIENVIFKNKNLLLGNNPSIKIFTNYKKGEKLRIVFNINLISEEEYWEFIDNLYYDIADYKQELNDINFKYNSVINSFFWKITFPLRFIYSKIRGGKYGK